MKNIIVSAGHGDRDPGATANGCIEHLEAYQITWLLRSQLEAKGHACEFVSCFQPLSRKIQQVNALHDEKAIDLAIEIHFNSAENSQAHGTECLYYSPKTRSMAVSISEKLSAAIGTADRGAKHRTDLGWLKQTQPPALIVEVCFLSNPDDAVKMGRSEFHQTAAAGITAGIVG